MILVTLGGIQDYSHNMCTVIFFSVKLNCFTHIVQDKYEQRQIYYCILQGGVDALPSVFEALTATGRFGAKVEVEPAPRVPSPESTIEYVDDHKNHT